MRGNILIIDDDPLIFRQLEESLKAHNLFHAPDLIGLQQFISKKNIDVVVVDLNLDDHAAEKRLSGLDYIGKVRERHPEVMIMALSKYNQVDWVVQAVKNGAHRYKWKGDLDLDTPEFREQVMLLVKEKRRQDQMRKAHEVEWTGRSIQTTQLCKQLDALAGSRKSFLLTGEPGTGKSYAVRYLHYRSLFYAGSREPVAVDLASMDRARLMDLVSQYTSRKQSFFREANNHILYLKHIDAAPAAFQDAILHMIRHRRLPSSGELLQIQVVLAMDQEPQPLISAQRLRPEFCAELEIVRIAPLRERRQDLYELIPSWLKRQGYLLPVPPQILQAFCRYEYPGNTVELLDLLGQVLNRHQARHPQGEAWKHALISPAALPAELAIGLERQDQGIEYEIACLVLEKIDNALQLFGGSKSEVARHLQLKSADNMKKTYIDKYARLYPGLVRTFPYIMRHYDL
ncbi:MAG: sigma 54-interacting transcriptional regulator [Bacteroidia bacterium]|nr:sigma 54-interacting transcriptional regulator [Bacteroidia bacterium]